MPYDLPPLSGLSLRSARPAQADVGALQYLVNYQQTDLIREILDKLSENGLHYFVSVSLLPKHIRQGGVDAPWPDDWMELEDENPVWNAEAVYELELKFYKVKPLEGSSMESPGFLMKRVIEESFLPRISREVGARSSQKPTQNGGTDIMWTQKDVLDSAVLGYDTYSAKLESPLAISLDAFCDAVLSVQAIFNDIPNPSSTTDVSVDWHMQHTDSVRVRPVCAGVLCTVSEAGVTVPTVNRLLFQLFRRPPVNFRMLKILRDRVTPLPEPSDGE